MTPVDLTCITKSAYKCTLNTGSPGIILHLFQNQDFENGC